MIPVRHEQGGAVQYRGMMLYETVMREMAQRERRGEKRGEKRGITIGEKRGITIGEKRGSYERAVQTARNLLAMGLSAQQVAEATLLTVAEVLSLK